MQYKLLASDFDNTLVPFGEPCPRPAVVKAVKKMQAAGGKFVLSTGRGYCGINKQQLGGNPVGMAVSWAASGSTTPSPTTEPAWWTGTVQSSPSTR